MPEKLWVVMWRKANSNGPWIRWRESDGTHENEDDAKRRAQSISNYHSRCGNSISVRVVTYLLAEQEKEQA